jgi:serine phosphatase RsbU (regulator of sigma subunit)/pSer/pThr/pTyr-binding forkhead associated (FHA) protein
MARNPELLVKPLHGEPFRFPLDKDSVTIGRSKKNDLVLADQWLSRHHAAIRTNDSKHYIADLESRNGTYVNGVRITEPVTLRNGDEVTLGDQVLRFVNEATGSVVLTDQPQDLEGTVVVPTEQLLAAARPPEDTWDHLQDVVRGSGGVSQPLDDSARVFKQNQILTALSQASMALISNRPVNELLEFILELAFKVIKAERGVLMLKSPTGELVLEAVRTNQGPKASMNEEITFSRSIADKVVREKVSILTNNALADPRFRAQESIVSLGIRSAMCVPLWNEEAVTGLIYVDSLIRENSFTQDDLTLLTSLANVAAIKLENAKLLEQMIEKQRMERELELARSIQQGQLPGESPKLPGWDLIGTNQPCYTIGGDYYDFIERPNGLALALGDVSGKGAGAALMMMVLRAMVHFAAQGDTTVRDICGQTNSVMHHNSPPQFYVTFFLGDLDTKKGTLRYVNAGHIPPILYHRASDTIERLESGGTVLGLFDFAPFVEGEVQLAPGDILVVFTDGLSEAWGEDEEEFGEERLAELVRANASLSAVDLEQLLQREVDAYTRGSRATDDRTVLIAKREPSA